MNKKLVVFKFGSKVLTDKHQQLASEVLSNLCSQIATFHKTHRIVIVSSGAVACGRSFIQKMRNPLLDKRAAASIGNITLFSAYQHFFSKQNIVIGQALLERRHFLDRESFLNLRNVFETLWENDIIPIVNENDTVTDYEIKFSDNDELAMLIATCFSAKQLFLGTSVNGVLDEHGQTITSIHTFDHKIYEWVKTYPGEKVSSVGLGGMLSKLNCAKIACSLGTEVVIFNAKNRHSLDTYLSDNKATICSPKQQKISSKRKWIAIASRVVNHQTGKIFIDKNANLSLAKRKNLLAVGIKKIQGEFVRGDYVQLFSYPDEEDIGTARTKLSSKELTEKLNTKEPSLVVANADEIIIYNSNL